MRPDRYRDTPITVSVGAGESDHPEVTSVITSA